MRDLDTDEVLAEFYPKQSGIHKDGKMMIMGEYVEDPSWVDVIITIALTCQQREREIRRRATNNVSGGDGDAKI